MKLGVCASVVTAGMVVDLATKAWARVALEPYGVPVELLPWLSIRLGFNDGVSFSMLSFESEAARTALLVVTGTLSLVFGVCMIRTRGVERLAFATVLAGAVPNVLDRAEDGLVTDFLDLRFGELPLFVFNLADVWITIGAALLVLHLATTSASTHERP